jgi:hypothetical protein
LQEVQRSVKDVRGLLTATEGALHQDIEKATTATELLKKTHAEKISNLSSSTTERFSRISSQVSACDMKLTMVDQANAQQDVVQEMLTKKVEALTTETNEQIKNFGEQIEALEKLTTRLD